MQATRAALSARARSSWLAILGQRSATALILFPLVLALAWFGGWVACAAGALAPLLDVPEYLA